MIEETMGSAEETLCDEMSSSVGAPSALIGLSYESTHVWEPGTACALFPT